MSSAQDDMDRRGHREAPEWARAKKWDVDYSRPGFEVPNSLAVGKFCPEHDVRLTDDRGTEHKCPLCDDEGDAA